MRRPYKRVVLAVLGGVLAAVLATMWFFNNYERKPLEINTGQSPAAMKNPLLAATRFLQALGMTAESHRGRDLLVNLPPVGDAILVYRQGGALSPTEMNHLYKWMVDGGHLVIQPKRVYDHDSDQPEEGDIARFAGVRLRYRKEKSDCGCPQNSKKADSDGSGSAEPDDDTVPDARARDNQDESVQDIRQGSQGKPTGAEKETGHETVSVVIDGTRLTVDFPNDRYLEKGPREPVFRIDSQENEGAYLLQYQIGRGKMTVLTSCRIFNNYNIDAAGHGWLLAWLAGTHSRTWLLYSNNMDGIFSFLFRHMPAFLFSLCGWVIFFIWAHQYRIGSVREPKKTTRRHILAHIDGLGRFNWHIDKAASLIGRIREPVLHDWIRRLPGKGDRLIDPAAVARLTGLTKEEVETGFSGPVTTEQDLIVVTRCLQKLRQAEGGPKRRTK
ncbi:MAG: hypothetical protein DSY90_05025 [Deltaproteobacteria bacterium]|nr:MAG: hypothetical protein DSY90_05025 [Deltaproteobacteria bacterium]